MKNNPNQTLYWSLSKPLKYMGLTLDEWGVTLLGIIPGIILLNSGVLKLGFSFFILGIVSCYAFKKFKKLSENFLLKSFLVAKNIMPPPKNYPVLLHKKVGR